MNQDEYRKRFLAAVPHWLKGVRAVDFRYLAARVNGELRIVDAMLQFMPYPIGRPLNFHLETSGYIAGLFQSPENSHASALELVERSLDGRVELGDEEIRLVFDQPFGFYSNMVRRDSWYNELDITLTGEYLQPLSGLEVIAIDNELRSKDTPFDGLPDLITALGLRDPSTGGRQASLQVRIHPPVDIDLKRSQVLGNRLCLALRGAQGLDANSIKLAVMRFPSDDLDTRQQTASKVQWTSQPDGVMDGAVEVDFGQADGALAVLMVGSMPVRRQWFHNPSNARNHRYVGVQTFDKQLKMVRDAVLENENSRRFEQGVSALFYLFGFSPALYMETNAPDILMDSPVGATVVIECTTRIKDFRQKLEGLVDRYGAVKKALAQSKYMGRVEALLIVRQPEEQIVIDAQTLIRHGVRLIASEGLERMLDNAHLPVSPDQFLDEGLEQYCVKVHGEGLPPSAF